MKTLTKSNGLWTGSLQKHMAASRREMNKSYGLQQAQLARMNIVRDSQRLQLSAADTIVRLEQLKDEIKKNQYKPPPKVVLTKIVPYGDLYDEENRLPLKVGTLGVVPNSNPALASTIVPYDDLYDEGKPDPPTLREQVAAKSKSAPTSRAVTPDKKFKNKGGLTVDILAKKAASPIKKNTKVSPTASEAPTVSTSTTAQSGLGSPAANLRLLTDLEEKLKQKGVSDPNFRKSKPYKSLINNHPKKDQPVIEKIIMLQNVLQSDDNLNISGLYADADGDGLGRMRMRGKFISKR